MNITNRAAIESACKFVEERVEPRKCDSDAVSSCWRCNSVYLAKRMRELLGVPSTESAPPIALSTIHEWFWRRIKAAGGHITDLSAFVEEVVRWTEGRHAVSAPAQLPESMSRDEMLKYYSEYANVQCNEALRYQQRIRELESALVPQPPQDERGQGLRYCETCEQNVSSPCNSADCSTPEVAQWVASAPAQQAGQAQELKDAGYFYNLVRHALMDVDKRGACEYRLNYIADELEALMHATPPQPVAAEWVTLASSDPEAYRQALIDHEDRTEKITEHALAVAVRKWFPDRANQADYFAAAVFGHPRNAHQEHIAAMAGTGSDESKKGEA